jgi:hypothetical protein
VSMQARGSRGSLTGGHGYESEDPEVDEPTRPGGKSEPMRGFSAQLKGVGLWDLVQMECLARSRVVVRVAGEGGVGYLYFDSGRVMHAATAHYVGERAALEILSWSNGSFQACERAWPDRETIGTTHEALILQAAKMKDESSNLVHFPGRAAGAKPGGEIETIELNEANGLTNEEGTTDMRGSNMDDAAPTPPRSEVGGDFPVAMRLSLSGAIVSNRGGTEELAETVAYAQRLMQLAGDLMGIDDFIALECTFTSKRCVIFMESNGDIVALWPRADANLQPLRDKLGL